MDVEWVKLVSWHAARPRDYTETSYCGRSLMNTEERAAELPGSGKTCESCLRITRRIEEHANKAAPDAEGFVSHDPVVA